MEDKKLLQRAKFYADAMAQGINPTTGEYAAAGDSLSDPKLQRCMGYISEILSNVINNAYVKKVRENFRITPEQKAAVLLSDSPIGVNELARRINAVIDTEAVKSVSGVTIASWLADNGYLTVVKDSEGHTKKRLNDRSFEFGISETEGISRTGIPFKQLVYDRKAQSFIVEHIENILAGNKL